MRGIFYRGGFEQANRGVWEALYDCTLAWIITERMRQSCMNLIHLGIDTTKAVKLFGEIWFFDDISKYLPPNLVRQFCAVPIQYLRGL